MAGHSQFKNIMHRKSAQDQKKAKLFTKISREIFIAAKSDGINPEMNSRLRSAIIAAREINMPKDKIENAIKKASDTTKDSNYCEIRYEGFGPHGVAIMVFTLTDNVNRTAGEVRSVFTKNDGSLGESGSVGYLFRNIGSIIYNKDLIIEDIIFETALSAGADDFIIHNDAYEIICSPHLFHSIKELLFAKCGKAKLAQIVWIPIVQTKVDNKIAEKIANLVYDLEELDDVQEVVTNIDLSV